MKSRDIFLPSLGGVLVIGLVLFQSCAHQNRSADEMDSMDEATYSDSESDSGLDSGSKEQAQTSDSLGEGSDLSSGSPENSLAGPLAENSNAESNNDSIESLEKELETGDLNAESNKDTLSSNSTEQSAPKEPSLENELESDSLNTSNSLESSGTLESGSIAAGAAAGELADSSSLEEKLESVEPIQPKTDELASRETVTPEIEPLSQETLTLDSKPRRKFSRASFKAPKIPASAITRKGTKLNRFYFVRKGDTPKSVAALIYGSSAKSSWLTKWNGKNWTPGQIIYYSSPQNPKDKKMDSLYKEHGLTAQMYEVSRGEWLSKIAQKKLGSPKSWTEIAVINGIKSPKSLEVGQKLGIYPSDLSAKPAETMIAKTEVASPSAADLAPVQPPPVVEPPPIVEPPAPVENTQAQAETASPIVEPPKESASSTSNSNEFDVKKFAEQEMFAGLMALAGILLLVLLVVKKRRKAREAAAASDDFGDGEEGFQPPTKLKRK